MAAGWTGRRSAGAVGGVIGVVAAAALAMGVAPGVAGAAPVPRELVAGTIVSLTVTGDGVPDDAEAVVLNVTATDTVRPGFVTAFSCDEPVPSTSNLNYGVGDVVANAVVAEVGSDGSVCLFTYAGADVIVDIAGYFPAGSDYSAVDPQRLVDTRPGLPLAAGGELVVPVTGRAGIGSSATTVAVNLTATEPQGAGYLTIYPCGEAAPLASNVNYLPGQDAPNLAIAKVGAAGAVCVTSYATSDVLVDVFGWFGAGGYTPLTPVRLVDTRDTNPLAAGGVLSVPVPAGASAAVLNVTATDPQAAGFLTLYPCGEAVPLASNVNYVQGQTVPNLAITKVGAGSAVCVYAYAATDVVVDLFGRFGAGAGTYVPLSPARLLDTRDVAPVLDELGLGPLFPGMTLFAAYASGAVDPPTVVACEITPDVAAAYLAPPVSGFVTVFDGTLETIVVTDGAVLPGGAGPGDDVGDLVAGLEAEGYSVTFSQDFFEVFGLDLVQAAQGGEVVLEALVDPDTGEVLQIASPFIPTCE